MCCGRSVWGGGGDADVLVGREGKGELSLYCS